jgi:hypothetical protein
MKLSYSRMPVTLNSLCSAIGIASSGITRFSGELGQFLRPEVNNVIREKELFRGHF